MRISNKSNLPVQKEERENYQTMLLEDMDYFFQQNGTRQYNMDLAVETHEAIKRNPLPDMSGVVSFAEENDIATITRVSVTTPYASQSLGKPMGNYITIEAPDLSLGDREYNEEVAKLLKEELVTLINMNFDRPIKESEAFTTLLCGLGNWNATPDAIGPMVAEKALVTRHIYDMTPREKRGGLRSVAAISPGVLGITGIETAEIISGVVDHIKPDLVIVIDALASKSISRLGTTVQLGDTGIQPGSGIGNKRLGINKDTLGVPVIAIGVPTVVHAITIVKDAMELLDSYDTLRMVDSAKKVLAPHFGDLVVTPKEVDVMVEGIANVIAGGLNYALHPAINDNEIYQYLQ